MTTPAEKPDVPDPVRPILIVDDEEIVLVALRDTLLREGYQVVASPHAIHALSVLKEQTFSVVITDQQMPLVSGLEFLAQVREIQPDATRILITAVLNLSTVIDAINKGEIYRFIVKPWLREELLATVKNAVQRHELISHNNRLQTETQTMNEKLKSLNHTLEEQNAQLQVLIHDQQENLRRSVDLCLQTMQTFYPTLGVQGRRTATICAAMADGACLSEEQRQTLEISALIHDIGLVGVPRSLIKRWEQTPEGLNAAENALIQHHPILGQELATFAHQLREVGPTIRGHHERYDGSGYPDKLREAEIPWLARLLAVAVSHAESTQETRISIDRISRASGSAFDPEAVKIFLRHVPNAAVPGRQREVLLSELTPGMVLAQGIYSENGVLLMPDGQKLTATYIDKLMNYNRINPISQSLLVYC